MTLDANTGPDLKYSDGIAAARTMIALEGNAAALQRRLPSGWELAPYSGDDLRGTSLRGANMLVPFHEVYAVRTHDGRPTGLPQLSYIAFISQARNQASGALALALAYQQGGILIWVTADKPNLPLYAAQDPSIVRWYQVDEVMDVVRS